MVKPYGDRFVCSSYWTCWQFDSGIISNRSAQEIERNREQSSLIVQAVSTGNADAACKNLISFIALGLLQDPKGVLGKCKTALDTIPVLPAAKTYTPTSDIEGSTLFNTSVVRTAQGNDYHYVITFSVPDKAGFDFNVVKIYAMQLSNNGVRTHDISLPDAHGSWKSGDRVTVSADLPKSYVEDSAFKSYLRFCVGSEESCLPGPNLLLPQSQ